MAPRRPFLSLSLAEAEVVLVERGFASVWAARLRRALLAGKLPSEAGKPSMPVPIRLIAELEGDFDWLSLRETAQSKASDGAVKHLLALADGEAVEAVRLPGSKTPSACLSSQVGCAVGCRFCASGLDGVKRNLEAHELLEQLACLRRAGAVRRLVFMGSGEPTHNLRAVDTALDVLANEGGIGPRHVLISTVGPASAIERIGALGRKITLAVSLHALDQSLRADLIPSQSQVDPVSLLQAADAYAAASGRPYQVEYVLLGGRNDSLEQATALAAALQGRRAHVSLIPWNAVDEVDYASPAAGAAEAFRDVLRGAGISVVLRRTLGGSADAACGQLRRRRAEQQLPV
jgi:23S rRNA (adenine2503-C2)-methyltransferase